MLKLEFIVQFILCSPLHYRLFFGIFLGFTFLHKIFLQDQGVTKIFLVALFENWK
jgi:hypothetical protein